MSHDPSLAGLVVLITGGWRALCETGLDDRFPGRGPLFETR